MRTIPAEEFGARCLELLDEIRLTREVLVITKGSMPYVKVTPVDEVGTPGGSVEDSETE